MISHILKFIFIHIPKTAGNSLSLYLKDYVANEVIQKDSNLGSNQGIQVLCEMSKRDIKHESINYYYELYGHKINDYYKFTIVRNPYDRLLSFYYFTRGKDYQTFDKHQFKMFILRQNVPTQYSYLVNKETNTNEIDPSIKIIRYENLMNELKELPPFTSLNLNDNDKGNDYPHINASINSSKPFFWKDIYDDELKDLVYKKYQKDFEIFNYDK